MVVRSVASGKSKANSMPLAHRRNNINVQSSGKAVKRISRKINLSRKQILAARKGLL